MPSTQESQLSSRAHESWVGSKEQELLGASLVFLRLVFIATGAEASVTLPAAGTRCSPHTCKTEMLQVSRSPLQTPRTVSSAPPCTSLDDTAMQQSHNLEPVKASKILLFPLQQPQITFQRLLAIVGQQYAPYHHPAVLRNQNCKGHFQLGGEER